MTGGRLTQCAAVVATVLMVTSVFGVGYAGAAAPGGSPGGEAAPAALQGSSGDLALQQASDGALYRVNAGTGDVDPDEGPNWTLPADTEGVEASGGTEYEGYDGDVSFDDSIPSGTPAEVFEDELYGNQNWTFTEGIESGEEYELRLYFAEVFHGVDGGNTDGGEGSRVFDVAVEGETVLDEYDIYADVGAETGVMKSFHVEPTDGEIDVEFSTIEDNAKISAVEVVPVESESEPDTLGGPESVDFGTVTTGDSGTETVELTNLGESGAPDVDVTDVSIAGEDADAFSHDFSGDETLAPGESTNVEVTFSPSDAESETADLEVTHSGTNSPMTVDLSGEGASDVPVGFSESTLEGFSAGSPTAIDFGPDGRAYVSTQGGTVYALEVDRTGEDSYEVVEEEEIDAIQQIPNHDDFGEHEPGENNRQITGLTVTGTEDQPVVYVSSSDPTIDVGEDDDDTDTNSGAISRLTFDWADDGSLGDFDHTVVVTGLPRSEENHATNGLDLSADGETLYVAQGGHTNKGAPSDNFGNTPEYALSAAVLDIDLAQIDENYQAKNLQNYDDDYPDLEFLYALPTVQSNSTDGDELPFGGNDGLNQAEIVPDGPVQVHSPGYRNPYDLVLAESDQLYAIDNGPNGGWGGLPVAEGADGTCTNEPNEEDSDGTGDQLHLASEGSYGGHPSPIRANPDDAGLYDANGTQYHDFDSADTPVPFDMANPVECDYQDPSEDNSLGPEFGWTGGVTEYTASNFGGGMAGDLLVVENSNTIKRVQLDATGEAVTGVTSPLNTDGALGITAQDDTEAFPGTIWTANHGDGDVTVFEPNDFGDGDGEQCTGEDDPSLDEDGDGYDNADEIDAGSDPCSAASTPPDFDDDGTSNVNDPDDDNDGIDDTEDSFAVDPENGLDNDLPAPYDFSPNSHPDTILDLGFTGVMMNGSNYQDLYDPDEVTAGGAANVLTVEDVGQGDAHADTNTQAHGYQVGVNADEPFTVETAVNGLPDDAESFQSQGVFVGTGDQDNYVKLTASGFSSGDGSGVQLATEEEGSFTDVANPSAPTAGNTTTLDVTVYPDNGTVLAHYAVEDGDRQFVDETTVPTNWFDTADGNGTAVGVIATSNGADDTFDATWQHLNVEPMQDDEPTVSADVGDDQTVEENETVELDATESTGDDLTYAWTQTAGPDVDLSDADTATPSFTAPDVDEETTLSFEVEVSDGENTDTATVNVTVEDAPGPAPGDTLYRVNAGGQEIEASDDGPAWSADTGDDPSPYSNVDESGSQTYDTTDEIALHDSVPTGTDSALFQTERYDPNSSDPADDPEMEWSFPVQEGETYELRLYVAEIFLDEGHDQQPREFDLVVEDETVLDDYNIFEEYGHDVGAVETFEVTAEDDTLDLEFLHEQENPKVSAIEVLGPEPSEPEPETEATMTVNGGSGDTDSSTYNSGSFEVTNDGNQPIESVTIDLSETALPDVVFDPEGTAGDQAGLCFNADSGADETGLVTDGSGEDDACTEPYSQPNNGENGSDGYEVLTAEFDDFGPGETFSFSADLDPTSIKGADSTQNSLAGPIGGSDVYGGALAVESENATAENDLFFDGSVGGSQVTATEDPAAAPALDVEGVSLDSTTFPEHADGAATVGDATQTITVSGTEPGETVTLTRAEGERNLEGVPEHDGTPGYDVEEYEANRLLDVEEYTATADEDGEAAVEVELTNSSDAGGLNYLVAAVGDEGASGQVSQSLVLEYAPGQNQPPTADAGSDQTVDENSSVQLDATGSSDPDGDSLTYEWAQTAGAEVSLSDADTATPTFTAPAVDDETTLTFEVEVSDGQASDTDTVDVTVENVSEPAPETAVSLAPASASVDAGETTTYDVVVENADGGVGAYTATVAVNDTAVAGIEDVELHGNPGNGTTDVQIAPDGSSAAINAALMNTSDTGSVTVATVTVAGVGEGTADLSLDVSALGTEGGQSYEITGTTGASMTVIDLGPIGEFQNPPTDPDGDDLYEDVNGDGTFDLVDVQALFANRNDETVQNNPQNFDFNGDGTFDLVDVQALFAEAT